MIERISPEGLFNALAHPGAVHLLAAGVKSMGGLMTVSDATQLLQEGNIQLWMAFEGRETKAVLLSEVVEYPRVRVLRLFGLAGSGLLELAALLPAIKEFAQEMGCDRILVTETRAGLELAVPGFKRAGVTLEMPLEAA